MRFLVTLRVKVKGWLGSALGLGYGLGKLSYRTGGLGIICFEFLNQNINQTLKRCTGSWKSASWETLTCRISWAQF